MTKSHPPLTLDSPIVRLRGHHLLCMLTWAGKGYTPEFTRTFDVAMEILVKGTARIHIVKGNDDLCDTISPETTPNYHCKSRTIMHRDETALQNIREVMGFPVRVDGIFPLTPRLQEAFQRRFKAGDTRKGACISCQFNSFCTDLAANNFADTRLGSPKP